MPSSASQVTSSREPSAGRHSSSSYESGSLPHGSTSYEPDAARPLATTDQRLVDATKLDEERRDIPDQPLPAVSEYSPWLDQTHLSVSEYSTAEGVPGRGVVLISAITAAGCAALNLLLTDTLTIFFDLCFVVVALTAAMSVLRRDLFTAGVLPPLLFAAVIAGIAVMDPQTFVPAGGPSKAVLTGLATHAIGLVAAYGATLAVVACRVVADRGSRSTAPA